MKTAALIISLVATFSVFAKDLNVKVCNPSNDAFQVTASNREASITYLKNASPLFMGTISTEEESPASIYDMEFVINVIGEQNDVSLQSVYFYNTDHGTLAVGTDTKKNTHAMLLDSQENATYVGSDGLCK